MALTDESNGIPATMLVGPTSVGNQSVPYPMYMGNGGNGFGGENGWWIILVIILLFAAGGWNNNGNNGAGFGGNQPIIVNDGGGNVQRGFDQSAIMSGISGIQSGVQNLSTQLCGATGDVEMAIANGFAGVEMGANARQIADMQTAFAGQTAMNQGFNSVQTQLAQCCCDNRLATAQTQALVQSENCADRAALQEGLRDIITNQTANTQRILDQLCNDKIDAKNEKILELQNQLNMASLRESQVAQNAFIQQGLTDEVDALYNRLSNCPVPTTPVYGRTPIFTCGGNGGCGCSGNM